MKFEKIIRGYLEENERMGVTLNCLLFSSRLFKSAKIVEHFHDYEKMYEFRTDFEKMNSQNDQHKAFINETIINKEFQQLISSLIFDSLLDSIKICICFEDYFKMLLYNQGCLIHVPKDKKLYKRQLKRPILIEELVSSNIISEKYLLENFRENTLMFSTILNNEPYWQYLSGIDNEILSFLKKLNNRRNKLHLHLNEDLALSKGYLNGYKGLN